MLHPLKRCTMCGKRLWWHTNHILQHVEQMLQPVFCQLCYDLRFVKDHLPCFDVVCSCPCSG